MKSGCTCVYLTMNLFPTILIYSVMIKEANRASDDMVGSRKKDELSMIGSLVCIKFLIGGSKDVVEDTRCTKAK